MVLYTDPPGGVNLTPDRNRLLLRGAACLLAISTLSSCGRVLSRTQSSQQESGPSQVVATRLDSMLDDPSFRLTYPGSPKAEFSSRDGCQEDGYHYREPQRTLFYRMRLDRGERERIQRFYRDALTNQGWASIGQSPPDGEYETKYYSRSQGSWEAVIHVLTHKAGIEVGLQQRHSALCDEAGAGTG